jgi:membrane-bound lytic murein transglycosylase B
MFTVYVASADLTPEQEAQLRSELQGIEAEIKQQQNILDQKAQEGKSIKRDIAILNAQIKSAQLKIRAHEISIQKLGKDIVVKSNTINALNGRIDKGRDSLEQIIQRTREIDNYSLAEALLSTKNISEFFIDLDTFTSIKQELESNLDGIKNAKHQNEEAKQELDDKRTQEIDLKINVESQKKIIEKSESEKRRLLSLNANEQKNYASSIAQKSKRANEIRNALFKLRDATAIKFGDAVQYAKNASAKTGVKPAIILAIIQQESNLGANVGSCYLTDSSTGAGIRKKNGAAVSNLMKLSRDVQPFLAITSALGRDPYKTLVSCPLDVGYGGAMGPSQFIPSTWVLFSKRIGNALGKSATDPWNPEDAFMATGMYMGDLGASSDSFTSQRNAACRYYSGRSCSGSNTFYGNQVMARVKSIQDNIDILANN